MDEKVMAIVGAAAGLTLAGRGLRPVAKLAIRGALATADATSGMRRDLAQLYEEAKAEQRGEKVDVQAAPAPPSGP